MQTTSHYVVDEQHLLSRLDSVAVLHSSCYVTILPPSLPSPSYIMSSTSTSMVDVTPYPRASPSLPTIQESEDPDPPPSYEEVAEPPSPDSQATQSQPGNNSTTYLKKETR